MIRKNLDESLVPGKLSKAVVDAERQVAFYLRQAFADDPDVSVLNGIRLECDGDSAQIDHLIIHKYGFVIIENKNITGRMGMNDRGERSRQFPSLKAIRSTTKRVERKAGFLKKWLDTHGPKLPRDFGIKREFRKLPVDVLIAIYDTATAQKMRQLDLDDVCEAEVMPDRVAAAIRKYQKRNGFLSLSFRPFAMSINTRDKISDLLIQASVPPATRMHTLSETTPANLVAAP